MYYLLETPVGIALFKKNEQLSLISKLIYPSSNIGIEITNKLNENEIPFIVEQFIVSNIPQSSDLNVLSSDLADIISQKYKIKAVCSPDQDFRQIKKNPFKWFDINKDIYNAYVLRMSHKMVGEEQGDMSLIDTIDTIEELDKNINNRIMRIRDWYSLHFPELNTVSDNMLYIKYLLQIKNRKEYLNLVAEPEDIPEEIRYLVRNTMGSDMSNDDTDKIVHNANDILKSIEYKNHLSSYLLTRCKKDFPNLYYLIGETITAKLLRKTGSISNLSLCSASTLQILGSEKAYNEAIKENGNTPKYGIIFECGLIHKTPDLLRGNMARKLAAKIALCARVDASKSCKDGEFGKKAKEQLEKFLERMEGIDKNKKKPITFKKRQIVSVAEYDQSKDFKKNTK